MTKRLTIKNVKQELTLFSNRALVLGLCFSVLFLCLCARLIYLQVIQHNKYATQSTNNLMTLVPIPPKRGLIYDRHGVLLAKNMPVFSLELVPAHLKDMDATILRIQQLIDISDEDLHSFYKQLRQHKRFDPVPLKVKLTDEEVARFSVNQHRFPGASIHARLIRQYPLGEVMSHVVGYVGRINAKELSKVDDANYSATNFIGKVGIERSYENSLHGTVGYKQVETNAAGRAIRTLKTIPPVPGKDLFLTIDSGLELVAEKALKNNEGAVVAIDPQTGEVLALVSHPGYDPNLFVTGIRAKMFSELQHSEARPLYNRALRGLYPMASTIKPYLALKALSTGIVTANFKIFDKGWFQLPNSKHIYRDWRRGGHGWISVTNAIIESCDTYFYHLAVKMGIRRIDEVLADFGFGKVTGIDMKEELAGNVPSPEWKKKRRGERWYLGDTVISGIGQGFMLATPLQLAEATSALALKGTHFIPHVLLSTKDPDDKIYYNVPKPLPTITLRKWVWDIVERAMVGVIDASFGTGFRFGSHHHYTVAAKTGTAQVFSASNHDEEYQSQFNLPKKLRDHSLFIGYAPLNHPKIAVAVIVEHSHLAPNVARKVMDEYLLKEQAGGKS